MKFATAVLVISLTTLFAREANATKKSKVCGMRNWPSCALQQVDIVTSNYSISVESASSADDEEVSFSLRVYRTECLRYHHMSHSLNWYRLEALLVEANTTTRIGKFVEPFESHRLETYACQGDSLIVFDTCEPHPLDLPRQYQWSIPRVNITMDDVLCFRLTIQDTDEQCKFTDVCISMLNATEKTASRSGSGGDITGSGNSKVTNTQTGSGAFGAVGASSNRTQRCHERRDCSNARRRTFCGTDGNTYHSRCHIRLQECITETNIDIERTAACEEEIDPVCLKKREEFRNREEFLNTTLWLPTCDCDGLYKAKQCDRDRWDPTQLECWCSYRDSFSQVVDTRRRIVDVCSDPATLDFPCPSRWTR